MDMEYRWNGAIAVFQVDQTPLASTSGKEASPSVEEALDQGAKHVVFNMRRITRPNSAILGWTVSMARRIHERGGVLGISAPTASLVERLANLGIEHAFRVFRNDEEAVIGRVQGSS